MTRNLLISSIFNFMILLTTASHLKQNLIVPIQHDTRDRSANANYTKIIDFWKENKDKLVFNDEHNKVVLVMGNTGAGKTTVISALIGRKLQAVEKDGYIVIVDEDGKIGTGISSETLIPELMTDMKRNITYVDCSGFRDNRNVEYEIASVYFQNVLMSQVQELKLVLIINYDSLKVNGNKNDFDDLFEHLGEFIKNLNIIHDGVALVATKVENSYETFENGSTILVDNSKTILNGIASYLGKKKEVYLNRTDNLTKNKMFADLIDVLLQRNEDILTRISLFSKPVSKGYLEKMPKTQREVNNIGNMILDNLHYVKTEQDDFGFALSKSLNNTVTQIIDDIFRDALVNRLRKLGNETLTYYLQMEKEYNDIELLQKRVSLAYDYFSKMDTINEPQALFVEFYHVADILKIPLSLTSLDIISEDIRELYFFTTVSNSSLDSHMYLLKNEMKSIIDSIKDLKLFYDFLDNLQENLAAHKSQDLRNDKRIENIMISCTNSKNTTIQDITNLKEIAEEIGSNGFYQEVKTITPNMFQLKHLKAVFSAFITKLQTTCISSLKQMTVKGYNVRISDVVKIDCWISAIVIQVFALNKVFIDCELDKIGTRTQLTIIAPIWEVVGGPKIILDGEEGQHHKEESAKSSSFNSENGANGLPGFPGGTAGHFFGVGRDFLNLQYLDIYVNGGTGGPGQHGGNGADGVSGEALSDLFFSTKRKPSEVQRYFNNSNYKYSMNLIDSEVEPAHTMSLYSIDVLGKPAIAPSDGGNGGTGGHGGYAGIISLNGLGSLVNMKFSNHSGFTGQGGTGGNGGRKTSDGRRVKFLYKYQTYFPGIPYTASYYNIKWSDGAIVPQGYEGISDDNNNGKKLPTAPSEASLCPSISSYKDFVRMNLFENIRELRLKSFLHDMENDKDINAQYTTLAFSKEFEGLEKQFLELRYKIDFIPFYDSLLTRIKNYAKLEKGLENKKVLNYIYTAGVTKIFALKQKRKGKTVVDLKKYLSTIETDVAEIQEAQHLQTVQKYRDDYKDTLNKKIQEAEDFIEKKIQPDMDKLWEQSDIQIKAIIDEIVANINASNDAIEVLEKNRAKIRHAMEMRALLFPLKLAGAGLSFFGPVGAGVGTVVTGAASIAEDMLIDDTPVGKPNVPSIYPNLKVIDRVTKIFDDEKQQLVEKLTIVIESLEEYERDLLASEPEKEEKRRTISQLKTDLQEASTSQAASLSDVISQCESIEEIRQESISFTTSESESLHKQIHENQGSEEDKKRREKSLRQIGNVKKVLDSVKVIFNFANQIQNDRGKMYLMDDEMSKYFRQLEDLQKMESQVYDIIIPDLRHIEETINEITNSLNGSSHVQLDIAKWTVRSTLRDLKLLLQQFTNKMSFELQSNLQRYVEKLDEGFSILIDIYDRIDSYSESVKQAEYMAHIVSASMSNLQVTDPELSKAMIDLKLIIHSNILLEKYSIALHAFKQHFFPFAAHVLQTFELPTDMQIIDDESLRFDIISRIRKMKNHIDESESTMGEYSKYIHEKKIFNKNTTGSSPFFVWESSSFKDEIQRLLKGSEIFLKADVASGLFHNSIKYNDIGIYFNVQNKDLQGSLTSVLKNFVLIMSMVGNNYYRCGERYYSISFDDDITISYTLDQDENKNWIDPNKVYTTIRSSNFFLSPYVLWSIQLRSVNDAVPFDRLNVYANETIDIELFGQGYYIEQAPDFNFNVCNEYLSTFYDIETVVKKFEFEDKTIFNLLRQTK